MKPDKVATNAGLVAGVGAIYITSSIVNSNVTSDNTLVRLLIFAGNVGLSTTIGALVSRGTKKAVEDTMTTLNL